MSDVSSHVKNTEIALDISFKVFYVTHLAVYIPFGIYHPFRLYRHRAALTWKSKHFLFYFHVLCTSIGGLELLYSILQNVCVFLDPNGKIQWDQSWVCTHKEALGKYGNFFILALRGLSGSTAVGILAMIAYFSRKEVVVAHHGMRYWASGHKVETTLAVIVPLTSFLGSIFQVVMKGLYQESSSESGHSHNIWDDLTALAFVPSIIACLLVLISTFIMWMTLNYTQRTMPFTSTLWLLVASAITSVGATVNNYALVRYYSEPTVPDSAYVLASWLYIVSSFLFSAGLYQFTYLFRKPPDRILDGYTLINGAGGT